MISDITSGDVGRVSVGEARKMLVTDGPVSFHKHSTMRAAMRAARDGLLFVVEGLTSSIINTRHPDAIDAVMRGVLRPPYDGGLGRGIWPAGPEATATDAADRLASQWL